MVLKKSELKNDGRQYPDHPIVGVGVVVWRDDKVLLVKRGRAPRKGQWSLPGGVQQLGETILQAGVREVREETGIDIKPLGIITALDGISKDAKGKIEYHYTLIEIVAEAGEGDPHPADDATDVCWAELDKVDKLCEWPEVERVVRLSALQRVL